MPKKAIFAADEMWFYGPYINKLKSLDFEVTKCHDVPAAIEAGTRFGRGLNLIVTTGYLACMRAEYFHDPSFHEGRTGGWRVVEMLRERGICAPALFLSDAVLEKYAPPEIENSACLILGQSDLEDFEDAVRQLIAQT